VSPDGVARPGVFLYPSPCILSFWAQLFSFAIMAATGCFLKTVLAFALPCLLFNFCAVGLYRQKVYPRFLLESLENCSCHFATGYV